VDDATDQRNRAFPDKGEQRSTFRIDRDGAAAEIIKR